MTTLIYVVTYSISLGDLILDLGCGTGNLSVAIAEKIGAKGKVVAVDPDKHRVAVAKSTFGQVENIEFKEGSAEILPCEKSYFDAVFMNYVLHWIEDKKNALRNIHKVLKSGGRLAMQFPFFFPSIVEKVLIELNPEVNFHKINDKAYFEDLEKIESYCKEAGFASIESTEFNHVLNYDLSSFLELLSASFHGVFDMDQIKEEKLDEFKMYLDEEGRVFDKLLVGVIIATKP